MAGERDGAALAVGVFAGLAAAVLIKSLIWVQEVPDYLSENLSFGRWAPLVVISPGIFFAWLLARHYGRHIKSGAVTETMVGVSRDERALSGAGGAGAAGAGAEERDTALTVGRRRVTLAGVPPRWRAEPRRRGRRTSGRSLCDD